MDLKIEEETGILQYIYEIILKKLVSCRDLLAKITFSFVARQYYAAFVLTGLTKAER